MEASFPTTTLSVGGLQFTALEGSRSSARDRRRPLVLCLHGFPDHHRTWRLQIPALEEAGFRVVAPLLRGYEPSSQPIDDDYHTIRMVEDVLGFIEYLGCLRVHLVGHDWGAVIGYQVAARAPERLSSLTAMAVPHPRRLASLGALRLLPRQLRNSWYMLFFQLRLVSDVALRRHDFALIDKLWRDWSPGFTPPAEEMRLLKRTFRQPGVAAAALGYYRDMFDPLSRAAAASRALMRAPISVPTLALTGERDGCLDTRLFDLMRAEDFAHGLSVQRIAEAGHFLHQEQPDEVNRRLIEFLRRHEPGDIGCE
ncbi:alpha/beta fold hydrolase [Nannocystis pusilla]|uniref:Alpha/beta hydrolase n=1 Tax=Nannocystis pusilla TaxID=889268 RepID=A0ABS7U307_9BACT|nr:alpha/beta hydrolase [Nannocystis pusilla]MBZ5714804.1 alpha/beta hydrolase [Nannocystis pusilla]